MLIKYRPKQDHVKVVPLIPVSKAAKEVKLTRNQIQLLPGTNEITDDEWLVIKDHLKRDIESGVISTVEKTVPKSKRAPEGTAKNLVEMPTVDAVALVENCTSPDTLTKWYNEETRDEVRVHIIEKMKELKMDPPKMKSAGSENGENDDVTPPVAPSATAPKAIEEMTKEELIVYAREKGISFDSNGTAEQILAEIKKGQA